MIKSVAKIQEQMRTLADELAHQGLRAKAKRLRCLATQMEPHAYAGLVTALESMPTRWGKPRLRRAGLNSFKVTR